MAKYILMQDANFSDLPVYPGLQQPFQPRPKAKIDLEAIPCGYLPEMDDIPLPGDRNGVDFIIDTIRQNPGEVTLVAIGPLTNIAAAFTRAPDIVPMVRSVTMMTGAFYMHFPEWNVICDAQAADIVFRSSALKIAVGLDVTKECVLSDTWIDTIRNQESPFSRTLWHFLEAFQTSWPGKEVLLHDPLALAAVFTHGFLRFKPGQVEVIREEGPFYGYTLNPFKWPSSGRIKPNCLCAHQVETEAFVNFFVKRLLQY